MTCVCGHDHDWNSGMCKYPGNCFCVEYRELKDNQSVIPRHQIYLDQLKGVEEKVTYILENIPETKEMKNKDFVFFYWHMVSRLNIISNEVIKRLDDPESIRRCRQLLVQHNEEKYGPTNEEHLSQKILKQEATYEYVLTRYM